MKRCCGRSGRASGRGQPCAWRRTSGIGWTKNGGRNDKRNHEHETGLGKGLGPRDKKLQVVKPLLMEGQMAYLHCHNCYWSQDDFWDFKIRMRSFNLIGKIRIRLPSWGYNPISHFNALVFNWKHGLWRPRRIRHDKYMTQEFGWKRCDPFSWWLIYFEIKRAIKTFGKQKWWTEKSWGRMSKTAICPNCGKRAWDID